MIKYFWAQAHGADVGKLRDLVATPVISSVELETLLSTIHDLISADVARNYDAVALRKAAPEIVKAIFHFRMGLRDKVAEWNARGFLSHKAQMAVRGVLRDARYGADMMGELSIGHMTLGEGQHTFAGFSGEDLNTLVHQDHAGTDGKVTYRSGDIVLVRGQAHNSAAIARVGDVDSQFSHIGMIYVDRRGKPWVVESLIEVGATINTLDEALGHGISRAVLLRHRDERLAVRAAEIIYDHVRKSRRFYRSPIPYDFSMELDGYRKLFCAKLVRQAFDQASRGRVMLPSFKTRLDVKNRDFIDRIGITALETFAPADIEIEPDFDMVAEWRDYRVTSDSRLQDLLMDKLFEWMDTYDYRFKPDFTIKLITVLGRLSSYLSNGAKELIEDVVPTVPRNMTSSTIGAVAMLHKTAQPVFEILKQRERDSIMITGHALDKDEVLATIDQIFKETPGVIGYLAAPTGR